MGTGYQATCMKCNTKFSVRDGGGFHFHLLHCDICGKEKAINFDEIGEPHLRYLKGLPGPYHVGVEEHSRNIQENNQGKPLSEKKYNKHVEKLAGKCRCGGYFKFKAKPRCPKCKSDRYKNDSDWIMDYD